MRQIFFLSVACVAACTFAGDYTSASYVQDGLVAQYDALDNQGTGTQDFSATTWKDLKGLCGDIPFSDCVWTLGAATIDAVGTPLVTPNTISPALVDGTIEILVEYAPGSSECRRWDLYGADGAVDAKCQTYIESNKNYYREIIGNTSLQFGSAPAVFGVRQNFVTTYSATTGVHRARVYSRGVWRTATGTNTLDSRNLPSRLQFARNAARGSRVFAIRVYNRILSDNEMEANRLVDVARFSDEAVRTALAWKTAADGKWDVAANWDGGFIPEPFLSARLTATGSDHTVAFDNSSCVFPDLTYLYNPSGTTTLDVCNGITNDLGIANFSVTTGGVVKVSAGSALYSNSSHTGATAGGPERVGVHGGTFLVEGGDVFYTNLFGKVVIDGSESHTGVVRVTGGRFSWQPKATGNALKINRHGRVEVTNGLFETWNSGSVVMDNGVIDVSGTGTYGLRGKCHYTLGSGLYRIRERGTFTWTSGGAGSDRHTFTPSRAGDTARMEFLDNAGTLNSSDRFTMKGHRNGGNAELYINTSGSISLGNSVVVGDNYGYARIDLLNGTLKADGMYGFRTAASFQSATGDHCVTGVVNMAGGSFQVTGSGWNKDSSYLTGCVIGDGSYLKLSDWQKTCYRGEFHLSGGQVSHVRAMPFYVGVGPTAYGEIVQTGGDMTCSSTSFNMMLGMAGGTGNYVISNGTAHLSGNLYVGGVFTNMLQSCKMANYPTNVHGGKGTLRVDGGSFRLDKNLYAGVEGGGTIAIGPAGTLDLRGNMVLSNGTTTAGLDYARASKITFTLGAEGSGVIDFTNAGAGKGLMSAEGESPAAIEVDATAYEGQKSWVQLIKTKATPSGTWLQDFDLSVTGKGVKLVKGDHNGAHGLFAVFQRGTNIIFR